MASIRPAFTQLRPRYPTSATSAPQWQQLRQMLQGLHISPRAHNTRSLTTSTDGPSDSAAAAAAATAREAFESAPRARGPEGQPRYVARDTTAQGLRQESQQLDAQSARSGQQGSRKTSSEGGERKTFAGDRDDDFEPPPPTPNVRAIPVSPSYFSRQAMFNDSYLQLQRLVREFGHLPTAPSNQLDRAAFLSLEDYRVSVGARVKASDYALCMTLVKRLHKIHPAVQPYKVKEALKSFRRDVSPHDMMKKDIPIDKFGRALGVGKRKTSTARAWVVEGTGEVLVNGKSLAHAFGRVHDRESAVWALKATARTDKYNVWALVDGGGTTGQAEALAMAVGKALLAHEPALKPALRRAGVVTRDRRTVERKKHGHVKARKKPTWVKR